MEEEEEDEKGKRSGEERREQDAGCGQHKAILGHILKGRVKVSSFVKASTVSLVPRLLSTCADCFIICSFRDFGETLLCQTIKYYKTTQVLFNVSILPSLPAIDQLTTKFGAKYFVHISTELNTA